MPTTQQIGDFAYGHVVTEDNAVAFHCSTDQKRWPWLVLNPADNIAIQGINYFSLTALTDVIGQRDPEKWTALTGFSWRVFDARRGHPTHGFADPKTDLETPGYICSFFNADGALAYRVKGDGVTFRNRDFEGWRASAKAKILALPEPKDFVFATPEAAGVATPTECFVSPLMEQDGALYCDALITGETGFSLHPYHDGSGDHVNSSHLCDAVQQVAHLIRSRAGKSGYPNGGTASFSKYVELDRPFRISLRAGEPAATALTFDVSQAGKPCTDITFYYA